MEIEKKSPEAPDPEPVSISFSGQKIGLYHIFFGLIFSLGGFYVFIIYRSYLWAAFIAILIYVAFSGIHERILRRVQNRHSLAAFLTTALSAFFILAPLAFLVQQLVLELFALINTIRSALSGDKIFESIQYFPALTRFLTGKSFFWIDYYQFLVFLSQEYSNYLNFDQLSSWLGGATSVLMGGISFTLIATVNLVFTAILLFFLFKEGHAFSSYARRMLPVPRKYVDLFFARTGEILIAVLRGNLFISLLQGMAVGAGFFIVGLPNPIAYGAIAAFFSLIPVIGTAIVWLPAAAFLFVFKGSYFSAIFLGSYGLGMYLFLENYLKPNILDKKLGIHPLFLFFAILGGLREFGISGVILGPLIVTLFVSFWTIFVDRRNEKAAQLKKEEPEL